MSEGEMMNCKECGKAAELWLGLCQECDRKWSAQISEGIDVILGQRTMPPVEDPPKEANEDNPET